MAEVEKEVRIRKVPKAAKLVIGIIVLLVLAAGITTFAIRQKPELLGLSRGQAAVQEEVDKLVSDVGKLIALPSDEKPTVATVTDVEKLKSQPFFKSAQNGDKVLIFTNARKVILYRPSENRIVDVGAVNINQQNQQGAAQEAKSFKVALYNGTTTVGLTRSYSDEILKALPNSEVTERTNAATSGYSESIIVDLGGDRAQDADQIAKALNLKKSSLPEGERKPENADFLIVVGADKVIVATPAASPSP